MIDQEKLRARTRRYDASLKGAERRQRYEVTAKALRRKIDFDQRRGRDTRLQQDRLSERERYEASGSGLPFYEWLSVFEPLPKLVALSKRPGQS